MRNSLNLKLKKSDLRKPLFFVFRILSLQILLQNLFLPFGAAIHHRSRFGNFGFVGFDFGNDTLLFGKGRNGNSYVFQHINFYNIF